MIIVKSKVKKVSDDCSFAGEFAEALNKLAHHTVKEAVRRAKGNKRKTVQAKDVYIGDIKSDDNMLVVKSKVKSIVEDMNFSSDFFSAFNELLVWHVKQACGRAKANGRKTVVARDL